jgi:hypothetical protein
VLRHHTHRGFVYALYHTDRQTHTHTKTVCVCLIHYTNTHKHHSIRARLRHGRAPRRQGRGRIRTCRCSVPVVRLSRLASHSRVGAPCCAAAAVQVQKSIMRLHVWVRGMMCTGLNSERWLMADLGYDCASYSVPARVAAVVSRHPRSKAAPPGVRLASFRGLASGPSTCGVIGGRGWLF